MSQEITVPEFYSKKNNNDIGVVLITPNQMICRSSKDNDIEIVAEKLTFLSSEKNKMAKKEEM